MIRRRLTAIQVRDDRGITLAELIVYGVMLVIVTGITATFMIQALRVNDDVTAVSRASNYSQLSVAQLGRDIRNAGTVNVADGGRLLVLTTRQAMASSADKWVCVGYYLDENDGVLRRKTEVPSTGNTTKAALIAAGSSLEAIVDHWPVYQSGIVDIPSVTPFEVLSPPNPTVSIGLRALAKERKPVDLNTQTALRPQSSVPTGCA